MSDDLAPHDPAAGARNLLLGCAGIAHGDTLLLIVEPDKSDHYHPKLAPFIAGCARDLGAIVTIVAADPGAGPQDVPPSLMRAIGAASHTIFLNRIGDQLRFAPLPGTGTKTMCYALDLALLGSDFAVTPYAVWVNIHARLVEQLDASRSYSIRCPRGTDLSMRREIAPTARNRGEAFTVRNFPVMVVPPVAADSLNGKLVLSQSLTSTYLHRYDDSVLPLPSPVTVTLDNGRIARIDGDPELVERAEAQFARVAGLFGGPQWAVNSWHVGINAFTSFPRPALSDIDRWSSVVFGSPRYAHFHMCGAAPGDICGQIFDPTIAFDEAVLWDRGRPAFLTEEEKHQLLGSRNARPTPTSLYREIGVMGSP